MRKDRPSSYRTEIRQIKENLEAPLKSVKKLCTILNLKPSISYDGTACKIIIWNKQLASYLTRFGKSHDKYIPKCGDCSDRLRLDSSFVHWDVWSGRSAIRYPIGFGCCSAGGWADSFCCAARFWDSGFCD